MPFNAMDFFNAGNQLGQANASPFTYGTQNVMDMFNKMQMLGVQTQMMANQERMKQGILNQLDPVRLEAQAKLNSPGLGGGQANQDSRLSGIARVGQGENQIDGLGTGTLGTNVPTKFHSITGLDTENQAVEVQKELAQKQLGEAGTDAQDAARVKMKVDNMRNIYNKAMSHLAPGVRASTPQPGIMAGLGSTITTYAQKLALDAQGKSNPEWIEYKNAATSFAQDLERGLYGQRGRTISDLVKKEVIAIPNGTGTQQSDNAQFDLFNLHANASINFYKNLYKQTLGIDAPQMYISKYENPVVNASQSQQFSKEDILAELKKRGRI